MNGSVQERQVGDGISKDVRHPRSVYDVGDEPDVRFSLANERTALAWIRTGLALVAGGVALTTLATLAEASFILEIAAIVACAGGGVLSILALVSWRRNERALRLGLPLPEPFALTWLVVGVLAFSAAMIPFAIIETFLRDR